MLLRGRKYCEILYGLDHLKYLRVTDSDVDPDSFGPVDPDPEV